jgi:hypothetical protein
VTGVLDNDGLKAKEAPAFLGKGLSIRIPRGGVHALSRRTTGTPLSTASTSTSSSSITTVITLSVE